jgi:hypothetical protein
MSLSAMLGKRVDLSQVRALFAAGKTKEAIQALKAQGLDPSKMTMFQQEALKNATGGLDLDSLQKIATRTGRSGGELTAENAGKENQVFLSAKSSAESAKQIGQEVASALANLLKTEKITGPKEIQRLEEQLKNKELQNALIQQKRIEAEKNIMTGGLAYMLGGALIGGLSGAGVGRLLKGGKGGTGVTASGTTPSATGSSMGGMFDKNGKPLTQSQINMKLTKGGTVPIGGANTPITASSSGNVSKLTKMGKGIGGKMLGIAGAGFDAYSRIKSGQSVGQTAAGVGGGMAGAYALGSAGASLGLLTGPFAAAVSPILGLAGGIVGYFGGSSIADALTGANEPTVAAQETIQTELNESQIAQGVTDGQLLSDSAYTIELQKEMVAQLGLSTTLLYEIADYNARGLFQSVNIDGKKVMDALASTSRKQFGVARNTMSSTTVR